MSAGSPARPPCVSAIVISYFTGPVLSRALQSLKQQTAIAEIMLIDNGNPPGAVARACDEAGEGAPITVLSGHGNIGFAAACNKGAQAARGDYLLFFNPDALMPADGVGRLLHDGSAHQRPWLIAPMLVGPDGEEQQGSRREALTPWRAFVEATRLYKVAPNHPYFKRFNLHQDETPDAVVRTPTISGACFLLPRADYLVIEGMDERYFLHVEDIDFCHRFRAAGGRVLFDPHVRVTHYKSSSRANPVRIEARKTAGLIRYFHTHYEDAYPKLFLLLVGAALWAVFALQVARRALARALRMAGMVRRAGLRAVSRARRFGARQSDR